MGGSGDLTQIGNSTLTIAGGTYSMVAGGSYLGHKLTGVSVQGNTGVEISGGTFTGNIFSGNVSYNSAINDTLGVTGNVSVTIDAAGVSNWKIEYDGQSDAAITFANMDSKCNFTGDTFELTGGGLANSGDSWVVMQGSEAQILTTFDKFKSVTLFGDTATGPGAADTDLLKQMAKNGELKWSSTHYELNCVQDTETSYQIVVSKKGLLA